MKWKTRVLNYKGIFKLVHRKVGLKIIALERSYFWHVLLLFSHHYFSLPAFAQIYTSYCSYFLLFALPVYCSFQFNIWTWFSQTRLFRCPRMAPTWACWVSAGDLALLARSPTCVHHLPLQAVGSWSAWRGWVAEGRSVAELGRGQPWPAWQFSAMEGDFLASIFPVRVALSALTSTGMLLVVTGVY